MVLAGERDDELFKTHQELCSKLNLDPNIITTSWETFESINKKFVLEGEKLQWLGCSIYVACCSTETPTLDTSDIVRGSGVNLTSLLRHSNLSFVQFFSNISKWLDMVQLSDDFRNKVSNIRSTFSVAYNTFKKYMPSFAEIFISPIMNSQDIDASKHRNRKMRPIPYTSFKIFEFVWNIFILLKAEEHSLGTELIKCHHLLYCCIDLALRNVLTSNRRDLVNPNFIQEFSIENVENENQEWPCIVTKFCNCDSVIKEALHMKIYTFRDLVHKLIRNGTLVGNEESFNDILSVENFDGNFRSVTKAYEAYLLSKGDFDERIFLAEYKRQLIEKEQVANNWTTIKITPSGECGDTSVMESPRNSVGMVTPNQLLDTPLTGRKFLGPREADQPILGDKSLSEKISRLHALIINRSVTPSESLQHLFSQCQTNPSKRIEQLITTIKAKLTEAFLDCGCSKEDTLNYLDIAVTLFYKYVESVLQIEKNITSEISALVEKDLFFQCMFVCCMEMVFFSYNFSKKFPWILEILDVKPIHFVKVIELIVRSKDHLFRELIKHLNRIEETVMENLAWKSDSPIWNAIANSDQGIPRFEDIALPGHLLHNDVEDVEPSAVKSPGPSAMDCFQSPISQVSRNLFPTTAQAGHSLLHKHTHLMIPGKDGNMKIIPIVDPERTKDALQPLKTEPGTASVTPRKTGSLMIIFRKFYNLAGVRLQHLCSNLGFTDFELKRKIWTIFEDSIRHTNLIKDRHLDQLLMCAIYVICKACNINNYENLFAIIMKFYRQQPQASSSVYRDVLIKREKIEDDKMIPEERNDLIQFYNSVYVKAMQAYAIRFQPNPNSNSNVLLSPLPAVRRNLVSPNINTQVVGNVFVKPLESSVIHVGSSYNYFFSRSPSKELKNINRAINNNVIRGKRLLIEDVMEMPSNKRISNRKIQSLVEERRSQNLE